MVDDGTNAAKYLCLINGLKYVGGGLLLLSSSSFLFFFDFLFCDGLLLKLNRDVVDL